MGESSSALYHFKESFGGYSFEVGCQTMEELNSVFMLIFERRPSTFPSPINPRAVVPGEAGDFLEGEIVNHGLNDPRPDRGTNE